MVEMEKLIGLFYGSDTGTTEGIATELEKLITADFKVENFDMYHVNRVEFSRYKYFIFGLSTWYDGQLQSDWDTFYDEFCTIDFTGKVAAFFGCGDQFGYGEWFVDGIGIVAQQFEKAGGKLIGKWSTEGYEFEASKALIDEHTFYGLAIDEDNQADLTTERIEKWCQQIKQEFETAFKEQIKDF
tara:strand:+ start:70015 stop:70569 length:555 start_codon:yes stop_codon:yes gene_type:complete